GFSIQKQSQGDCLSPLDETALFINQSSGGTKGQWFWGDETQTPFSPSINPTHQYNGLLPNYKVMLAIQNEGGCADTVIKNICYHDTVILYLPTAFTPNGDGINDAFQPDIYGSSDYRLMILNRWGEIVYESKDKKILWDGTKNNQDCPEGVYAVILEYKSLRQSKRFARSSLTLMRPKSP
ncbi:MAG: gliding motility-associated C-terminal domain-containing protein, partial [Bacteroidota bacterium]